MNALQGAGQDRKLCWQTLPEGETSSNPGHQQSVPALTGNSANAATVAASRTRQVFLFTVCITALPGLTST